MDFEETLGAVMDIKSFYDFGTKLRSASFHAEPVNINTLEEKNNIVSGLYDNINFPIIFKHTYGNKVGDILDTGSASLFLISDKLKNTLEKNNLTGWKTYPVQIFDKKGDKIQGYHGFSVTGRCGPVDYRKCEITEKRLAPEGPLIKHYKGLYIGLDKWDGSDFFIPEGTSGIKITQKAMNLLKTNKLTNLNCKNLMDYETPVFFIPKNSIS